MRVCVAINSKMLSTELATKREFVCISSAIHACVGV
jgi:hypothetical protein